MATWETLKLKPKAKPQVSTELIDHLRLTWPNACPSPDDTERAIWMAVGANQVVAYLEALHKDQQSADAFDDED